NDKRFFLKTQNKREIKFLLSNLKIYVEHLRKFPHSLLVKFLGTTHNLTFSLTFSLSFTLTFSLSFISLTFSLTFSLAAAPRRAEPEPVLRHAHRQNQEVRPLCCFHSQELVVFVRSIDAALGLLFSLLYGKMPGSVQSPVQSASLPVWYRSRSVNPGSSPIHAGVPGAVLDDDAGPSPEPDSGLTSSQDRDDSTRTSPRPAGTGADSPDIPDFRAQNRRLLPNLKNPLHVIDGPEQRYFIGIIDVFTVYGLKKRLEHLWKSLRHHGRSFSTVSPQEYSGRLRGWVRDHSE
uniref:Phosphatidylinositol-4-phosphate 5-kinase like 1 n=1 Tax=Poecilia formosa TaxID=48698 RepID=A0A087XJN9_POEFO